MNNTMTTTGSEPNLKTDLRARKKFETEIRHPSRKKVFESSTAPVSAESRKRIPFTTTVTHIRLLSGRF